MASRGEAEYRRFLIWEHTPITRNSFHDQIEFDCGDTDPVPAYPLTADETKEALQYARFLGQVCYQKMLDRLPVNWREL